MKKKKPRLGPEEEADLPPQFRAKEESLRPEEAHRWKLEHWLRCRCEYNDFFDMCLNCITHRQANDLVN